VGVYIFERPLTPDEEHYWSTAVFYDGATATHEWRGFWNLPEPCDYGGRLDIPLNTVIRAHAYVRARDQTLWTLVPCLGWRRLGRLLEDGRLESRLFARGTFRRVSAGDYAAFDAIPWDEETNQLFWRCQEPYETTNGDPIPEPPQ